MRTASLGLVAVLLFGCGGADDSSGDITMGAGGSTVTGVTGATSSTSASSTSATTGSGGGAGGAGGSGATTTTGTAGAGTGTAGGAGAAGSNLGGAAGTGPGDSDASTDASTKDASDAGAPKSDVVHDVVPDSPSKGRQVARPIGAPYAKNGYWEYLPPGYGDGAERPLLVFWHGVGENGAGTTADLAKILLHGPPKLINLNQWTPDRPFIVLSPQHAGNNDCPTAMELHDFFTFAMGNYDVDLKRVYLTGLSCGARGGWSYLGQYKGEQVVAAALIAADSSVAYNMAGCSLLSTTGIWCFHGGADNPAPDSAGMMNFMNCPQPRKDAKYTEYPGVGHVGSWEAAYDNMASMNMIVAWLLGQSR